MANRGLGSLTIDLILRLGGFKQGAGAAARETDRMVRNVQSGFGKLQRMAGAVGVGLSFTVITAGLARSAAAAIEYGDEISKAAAKTGVGAQAFSELAFAAKQNDIELDALGTAFKKLQVTISEAGSGSKTALANFDALGLKFEELRALRPEDQFSLIAEQISRLKDPADRTRAAIEFFGKAGADLLPLFEDGAEGVRKLREEAQRLGASLTEEQVKRLADADDEIKRMGLAWSGLATTLTAEVAPGLTAVFKAMSNLLAKESQVISFGEAWASVGKAFKEGGFFGTSPFDILRQIQQDAERTATLGSDRRTAAISRGGGFTPEPPGFRPEVPAGEKLSADEWLERMGLGEIPITVQKITKSAALQLYEDLRKATETAQDKALADWIEFENNLKEAQKDLLIDTDPLDPLNEIKRIPGITAQEAARREAEYLKSVFEPIEITAEKIFPKAERSELDVFFEEASRSAQQIFADFLFDPFKDGIKGLGDAFVAMIQRMAAEALAAQLASKLFGAGGVGSGGGWLGTAIGVAGAIFGGGVNTAGTAAGNSLLGDFITGGLKAAKGLAGGGTVAGPAGIDKVPAWLTAGEFVVRAPSVKLPGVLPVLRAINAGVHHFADGGLVGGLGFDRPLAAAGAEAGGAVNIGQQITNYFSVSTPDGRVSRATELQISAAAARGAARANRRNN